MHAEPLDAASLWVAYNDAANTDDFATMAALVAPDLAVTENGAPGLASAEEDDRAMRQLRHDYPDYRREAVEVIGLGDRAVARWRMVGTPRDPALPVLDIAGCSIVRVSDGVIVEAHLYTSSPLPG